MAIRRQHLNGVVYGVQAPPSSRYSVRSTPTPQPSSALSEIVGFRYQPLTPGTENDADVSGASTSIARSAAATFGSGPTSRVPVCGVPVWRSSSVICSAV